MSFILDVPDKPEGPVQFSDITKDSVKLSWQPPNKDGGSPLTDYVIEQRDTRRTQWTKAGSVDKDTTSFVASKLIEDNEYVFRVTAVNAEGESESLESKEAAKPKQPICKHSSLHDGNFVTVLFSLLTFFKINFFVKFFEEHYQSAKRFRSRTGPKLCRTCRFVNERYYGMRYYCN